MMPMKKNLLPFALLSLAAIAAPLKAVAADQPISFELASNPVAPSEVGGKESVTANVALDHVPKSDLAPVSQADMPVGQDGELAPLSQASVALNFDPPSSLPSGAIASASPIATQENSPSSTTPVPPSASSPSISPPSSAPSSQPSAAKAGKDDLFAGGSESLVARTVGAAEGTRSADGGKTENYQGHVDPGNGVWNRGTFSYQFGNEENLTADEADRRQLAKIKRIYESVMLAKAAQQGLAPLTLAEELNGIDMINQAPLAVTEEGGYIDRLAEAKQQKGLRGEEAILKARVWAFWDPQKNGWDAPGLRAYDDMGKEESIRRDQDRRMGMINKALDFYEQQHGAIARHQPRPQTAQKVAATSSSTSSIAAVKADGDRVADLIIYQNRSSKAAHQG